MRRGPVWASVSRLECSGPGLRGGEASGARGLLQTSYPAGVLRAPPLPAGTVSPRAVPWFWCSPGTQCSSGHPSCEVLAGPAGLALGNFPEERVGPLVPPCTALGDRSRMGAVTQRWRPAGRGWQGRTGHSEAPASARPHGPWEAARSGGTSSAAVTSDASWRLEPE